MARLLYRPVPSAPTPSASRPLQRLLDANEPVEVHRMRERSFIVLSGKEGPDSLVAEAPFTTNPEALEPAERAVTAPDGDVAQGNRAAYQTRPT